MDCKVCTKCKVEKETSEFGKRRYCKDGLQSWCKECKYTAERVRRQTPEVKAATKAYHKIHDQTQKRKDSKKAYQRIYNKTPQGKQSAQRDRLKRLYGITLEEYNNMVTEQNGSCWLCGNPEKSKNKQFLSVDHNHITGKIRHLLCSNCNTKLGWYETNKEKVRKYLEEG